MVAVALGTPKMLSPTQRLLAALERGASLDRAADIAGVGRERARLLADHLERAGLVRVAGKQGACAHGACGSGPATPEAAVHCAGCPLAR